VAAIRRRPGWDQIAAVKTSQIYEIDGADILAPGPSLVHGVRHIHEIIQTFHATG
jgi:iron complex transport system substrate-binding protein